MAARRRNLAKVSDLWSKRSAIIQEMVVSQNGICVYIQRFLGSWRGHFYEMATYSKSAT